MPLSLRETIVAYSGGGDSTALIAKLRAQGQGVCAIIIDHRLREGSAQDAARAAEIAESLGARAQILSLDWAPDESKSQASARTKRYDALALAARAYGATEIAFAHTRDDQAETVAMRLGRGSGLLGLAGMGDAAPWPLWPQGRGLRVRRPLLGAHREDLRAALAREGINWLEDPANGWERFERVRIRRWLAEHGLAERFAALADSAAAYAHRLHRAARALADDAIVIGDAGELRLDLARYREAPSAVRLHVLGASLAAAGAAARAPDANRLNALDAALLSGGRLAATLSGARVSRAGEAVRLRRDPGGVVGRGGHAGLGLVPWPMATPQVWDARLEITVSGDGCLLGPAGAGVDPTAPVLISPGGARLSLAEAARAGLVEARALLRERMNTFFWRAEAIGQGRCASDTGLRVAGVGGVPGGASRLS